MKHQESQHSVWLEPDGQWRNYSLFPFTQAFGERFDGSTEEILGYTAQVMVDLLNAGDMSPSDKKQRRLVEWAVMDAGLAMRSVTGWAPTSKSGKWPHKNQIARYGPLCAMAKIRACQYLWERIHGAGLAAQWESDKSHILGGKFVPDNKVGVPELLRPEGASDRPYLGEDGLLVQRYAEMRVGDGPTILEVPHWKQATSRDRGPRLQPQQVCVTNGRVSRPPCDPGERALLNASLGGVASAGRDPIGRPPLRTSRRMAGQVPTRPLRQHLEADQRVLEVRQGGPCRSGLQSGRCSGDAQNLVPQPCLIWHLQGNRKTHRTERAHRLEPLRGVRLSVGESGCEFPASYQPTITMPGMTNTNTIDETASDTRRKGLLIIWLIFLAVLVIEIFQEAVPVMATYATGGAAVVGSAVWLVICKKRQAA